MFCQRTNHPILHRWQRWFGAPVLNLHGLGSLRRKSSGQHLCNMALIGGPMKATDLLVKALEKEKVKYVFGVPGVVK